MSAYTEDDILIATALDTKGVKVKFRTNTSSGKQLAARADNTQPDSKRNPGNTDNYAESNYEDLNQKQSFTAGSDWFLQVQNDFNQQINIQRKEEELKYLLILEELANKYIEYDDLDGNPLYLKVKVAIDEYRSEINDKSEEIKKVYEFTNEFGTFVAKHDPQGAFTGQYINLLTKEYHIPKIPSPEDILNSSPEDFLNFSSESDDKSPDDYMSLISLGLAIVGTGTSLTLAIKDYEKFEAAFKSGKFITNYKGLEKIWSLNFHGNKAVSESIVSGAKAVFNNNIKMLKLVKVGGITVAVAGGIISGIQYVKGDISGKKLTVDLLMTGITFIPPYGWVVSSVYFLVDTTIGWDKVFKPIEKLNEEINYYNSTTHKRMMDAYWNGRNLFW